MYCKPALKRGHHHVIATMDYFTKWAKAMPTVKSDGERKMIFVFNQIISWFRIPKEIVNDHGSHFHNDIMIELASKLGFKHDHSSPYYRQENGQVEVVNKCLKSILQKNVRKSKSNVNVMLYPKLWAYQIKVNTSTDFSLFQLVHGVDSILPIEFEIPSLKLEVNLLPNTTNLQERIIKLE
jgi:transposase InsO family protein